MFKVITFGTLKGGTGKTSTCFNLAGLLAEDYKVLLIDVDPQTNLSLNAGIDVVNCKYTVKHIFDNKRFKIEDLIFHKPIKSLPNIDIIPSSILLTASEFEIINKAGRERFLYNFICDNADYLERNYDYILIDTNPSMSVINQNAFLVADSIILISDVSLNGIQGAELFISLWESTLAQLRMKNNIAALVLNNVDTRIKLSKELRAYCNFQDDVKDIVLESFIPSSVSIKETELEHKPINVLSPNVKSHLAFAAVYNELKTKGIA